MTKVKFLEGREVTTINDNLKIGYLIRFGNDSHHGYVIWDDEDVYHGLGETGLEAPPTIDLELCEIV